MLEFSSRVRFADPTYVLALFVSAMFVAASFAVSVFAPDSTVNTADIAIGYAILITLVACMMLNRGGGMSAIAFFLLGTAIFFGLGTYLSVHEPQAHNYFTSDERAHVLSKVNLINALSVFVVVLFAGILGQRPAGGVPTDTATRTLDQLRPWLPTLLFVSIPCHALAWLTFPHVEHSLLHSILRLIDFLPLFSVFVGAALFHRINSLFRLIVVSLVLFYFAEGLLSLSKRTMLSPILVMGTGLWIGGYYRRVAATIFATAVAAYMLVLTAIVPLGRAHPLYHPWHNTIGERAQVVSETVANLPEIDHAHRRDKALARLSPTQFSATFVLSYDLGARGHSLEQASYVLIPRIFWSEKPLITPGRDFDSYWRGSEATSGLGIGYPAEAYWNHGWAGVVIVSAYLGLIVGWFTQRWYAFQRYGLSHVGIFVFGSWIMRNLLIVESNIVGTFFGGMIKLAVLILLLDATVRLLRSLPHFVDQLDAIAHPALVWPAPPRGIATWVRNRIDLMRFYSEARHMRFRSRPRQAALAE
ncbi:MAG: hypothetical protein AAF479_13130 [Pseudomonadota bacterium]